MKKHSAIIAQPSTMPGTAPAMNSGADGNAAARRQGIDDHVVWLGGMSTP